MIPREYINADGFVTIKPNDTDPYGDGNEILQTGLAYACELYPLSAGIFPSNWQGCLKSETIPLIYRSPHKKSADDTEKADDYWGAFLCFPMSWSRRILIWAEMSGWYFDVQQPANPRLDYRFDRFLPFPGCLRIAAGNKLPLFDTLFLAGSIVYDAFQIDEADGNMKAFCRIRLAEPVSFWCAFAAVIWRIRVRKKYGYIGASWAAYFGEGHPLNDFEKVNA